MSAAYDVQIESTSSDAKVRSPALVLLFSVVTLGIYSWFWWYRINRELATFGRSRGTTDLGTRPGTSTAAFVVGGLVIIPLIWTIVTTTRRVSRAKRLTGQDPLNGWLAASLFVLTAGIGGYIYLQMELNRVWRSPGMSPLQDGKRAPLDPALAGEWQAKLDQLRAAGALSDEVLAEQRTRLGLA